MSQGSVPSVSVVMPAYNAEKYLREAIDSILAQTYTDFEFIIINDGSTDKTKEIILGYSDPRIVYLENEQNSGICVTLNKGLDAARGRYIARMDADDISLPDRFDVQVHYMDTHPEIGVCGGDVIVFGEGIKDLMYDQLYSSEECVAGLLFNPCFAHPSVLIRHDILKRYNLRYKNEFRGLEDFELWWQISRYCKINNIPHPILRYRRHIEQETQNVSPKVTEALRVFSRNRFSDLGIEVSDDELILWNDYSEGNFSNFDDDRISQFIRLTKKVINDYPYKTSKEKNAVRLTMAKSVSFILSHIHGEKHIKQRYYNKALKEGVFPLIWYVKVSYHNLLK